MDIKELKILVTGATGFIGSRIVERLYFEYNNIARCLVRNCGKIASIARFKNEIAYGDLLDYNSLSKATKGIDVVLHCAYGNTSDNNLNSKINVDGTENLCRASLKNNVKRFIYLSTVEVYGKNRPSHVDERTNTSYSGNSYADSKLEAEKICLKYRKDKSLPIVILRPPVVYGPYAPVWTIGVVNRIQNKGFSISDKFNGLCNPLYIDDLVEAIFLSIKQDNAVGEIFNISSGEKLTWNEYYTKYNEILSMPPLKKINQKGLKIYEILKKILNPFLKFLKLKFGDDILRLYYQMREKGTIPNLKTFLQKGSLLEDAYIYNCPSYYSIKKAKKKLGFQPNYKIDRGLKLVKQWLIHISQISKY